jgi:putative colanic acid biosynthesis acetyltransferase WcaF
MFSGSVAERPFGGRAEDLGHSRQIDLSVPDNSDLDRGRSLVIEALWYFLGLPLLRSAIITSSGFRCRLLRLFGAKIGAGVYIKPGLRVKFPWYLEVRDHCWLGEDLWIDNLAQVTIGPHACVSQGAYLCTGNHDWSSPNMKLFRRPIVCGRGSWVGARSVVCPGVTIGDGAILTAGSVAPKSIPSFEIHAGNPAAFVRRRALRAAGEPLDTADLSLVAQR